MIRLRVEASKDGFPAGGPATTAAPILSPAVTPAVLAFPLVFSAFASETAALNSSMKAASFSAAAFCFFRMDFCLLVGQLVYRRSIAASFVSTAIGYLLLLAWPTLSVFGPI